MHATLVIHVVAGGLGLVAGAVALAAAKGARLHRKSGMLFVYAMLTMSLLGAAIAAFRRTEASVIAGLLTAYLVITALSTVRAPTAGSRRLDRGALLVALAIGLASLSLGIEAIASGAGSRDGIPAGMFLLFGSVALLAGIGDLQWIRSGGLQGPRRIARHLWRMCFALWIATASFFLGQADELPKALRIPALLALPVVAVLVVMFYWLWRVRRRRVDRSRSVAPLARCSGAK